MARGVVLLVGSRDDGVIGALRRELERLGVRGVFVDEQAAGSYAVEPRLRRGTPALHVYGGDCAGTRPVSAIFLRHAPARSGSNRAGLVALLALQRAVDALAECARCLVVNRPRAAVSNYSKLGQVALLAGAGFDVPETLVTTIPAEARAFLVRHGGRAILKGASNVPTFARLIDLRWHRRLSRVRDCPVLLQEYVEGEDLRLHVVGTRTIATRIVSRDEDYRRALRDGLPTRAEPGRVPERARERAVRLVARLGLAVAGIDFKRTPSGRLACLELNPFPQFTYYEHAAGQRITPRVAQLLARRRPVDSGVFA